MREGMPVLHSPQAPILSIDMSDGARDITGLLTEMRQRRTTSEHSSNPIRQTRVAERMGVDASFVSRLEKGERSITSLEGAKLYELLLGYNYTPLEIKGIVEEFSLNYPPQLVGDDEAPPGMVIVLYEGSISRATSPRDMRIPVEFLRGRAPNAVRLRSAEPSDLATTDAQASVSLGTLLVLTRDATPRAGSRVIVKQGNREALVVWPLERPEYATPYRATDAITPLLLTPGEFQVVAVAIGGYEEYPH